jgi:hypothetical protein
LLEIASQNPIQKMLSSVLIAQIGIGCFILLWKMGDMGMHLFQDQGDMVNDVEMFDVIRAG